MNEFEEFSPVFLNTNYKNNNPKSPWCAYNSAVICPEKDKCKSCGWNPVVDAKRRPKVRERVLDEQ